MKEMAKIIRGMAYKYGTYEFYADFVKLSALSISNAVDKAQWDQREKEYLDSIQKYLPDDVHRFPELLGMLINELEQEPRDVLGELFHELELHNEHRGQYFSPYPLCKMMAQITLSKENAQDIINKHGFISANEPACGSGAMVIALSEAMRDEEINYQQHLHVTAVDIDIRCVHMAYLQLSLLHVPAVVVHGDTLALKEHSHWYTPAHVLGLWGAKIRRRNAEADAIEAMKEMTEKPNVQEPEKPIETPEVPKQPLTQLKLF